MRFEEKLKHLKPEEVWQEYCGFLDLDMESYMVIQRRLMNEQIRLWSGSALGKKLLKGKNPQTIDEFRKMVPLTSYEDYADTLLQKKGDMLPDEPIIWIQTTWEGGMHPIKVAPYTKGMLDTYSNNVIACMILSTSTAKGKFDVKATDKILYALAPLPFATGLLPLALHDEIGVQFLPPVKEAVNLSFSERNKKGFKMGMKKGIQFFFGLGSVAYFVSLSIGALSGGKSGSLKDKLVTCSPSILVRYLKAKSRCRKENRDLKPKDLFRLKGFMCAGTDNWCYKDDLEDLWGIRPMELFAGTEPTCVGTETWSRKGMYFFPDAAFYEFIPENEMLHNMEDPSYEPMTCLMDEVVPGEKYEIVLSILKGGAFMRYRVGDTYRCAGLESREDATRIPRFEYVDRVPSIIDIAGFTRISENSIAQAIQLSGLNVENWIAVKEYNENNRPLLHLYVELNLEYYMSFAVSEEILRDHLSVYFKYVDQDYKDLKRILGVDPLKITILKCGTFEAYQRKGKKVPRHVNPSHYEVSELIAVQDGTGSPAAGRSRA